MAMRRSERGAFKEFFERYAPLMEALARLQRLPDTDATERAMEFLDDAALRLSLPTTRVPRSLAAYLAASFRKRSLNGIRDARRRLRLRDGVAADAGGSNERMLPSTVSENAARAAHGPLFEPPVLAPTIERLALELERGLSSDERRLLGWLGQRVPQREIAEWLGTTHGALRVRVTRLRARLRDAAFRHAERLDPAERAELDQFFRRVDIVPSTSPAQSSAGDRATPTRHSAAEDSRP
jgi:DNA-directed RNA polymerase specialized sigma24 family protein